MSKIFGTPNFDSSEGFCGECGRRLPAAWEDDSKTRWLACNGFFCSQECLDKYIKRNKLDPMEIPFHLSKEERLDTWVNEHRYKNQSSVTKTNGPSDTLPESAPSRQGKRALGENHISNRRVKT